MLYEENDPRKLREEIARLQEENYKLSEGLDQAQQENAQLHRYKEENQYLKDQAQLRGKEYERFLKEEVRQFLAAVNDPSIPICGAMSPRHGYLTAVHDLYLRYGSFDVFLDVKSFPRQAQ